MTTYTYDGSNQHLMSVTAFDGRVTSYGYNTISETAAQNALIEAAADPKAGTAPVRIPANATVALGRAARYE